MMATRIESAPTRRAAPGLRLTLTSGLALSLMLGLAACGQSGSPRDREARQTYMSDIAGRWTARPDCAGMMWNFERDAFTTPGETHCARLDIVAGAGDTVRAHGARCTAEGETRRDMVLDIARTEDGLLNVTGIGNPVSTLGWSRCGG